VHERAEDPDHHEPAAARVGRHVAGAAGLIACLIVALVGGLAAADPLKPITTHNGWAVDVDGFVEVDGILWDQHSQDQLNPTTGAPLNTETIELRRGFLRFTATKDAYFGELEFDGNTVNGPTARVITAQVGWTLPDSKLLQVAGGLMLTPFGTQVPLNARFRTFLEQPTFLRALFPGDDDGGVVARGAYGIVRYSLAAMNGAQVGDTQWKGLDPSSSYDVMGRLGTDIELPRHGRVTAGVSALDGTGLHPGQLPTKDQIVWVDQNQDGVVQLGELTVIPGQPGEPSQTFHRDALDVDAALHWCICALGNGALEFEGAIATNLDRGVIYADPIVASRNLRELGYSIDVVQDLGKHAFAGIRYDYYNADRDASEPVGISIVQTKQVFQTWGFLAAARWDTARLSLEYDRVRNPLGLSDNGLPTSEKADRLTVRGQVEF
jgi:hypothetical protein